MRKRLPLLVTIILLIIAIFFALPLLLPQTIPITRIAGVKIKPEAAFRVLTDTGNWHRWWPSGLIAKNRTTNFQGIIFGQPSFYYHAIGLKIDDGNSTRQTRIIMIPAGEDSVIFNWTDTLTTSISPAARLKLRAQAGDEAALMDKILGELQHYLANPVNVYGFRIIREVSRDSTLVSELFQTPDSPATSLIYRKLDGLRSYIASRRAEIVNFPMMHIEGKPGMYLTMLAYPVNKVLPDSGTYKFKRFLPWKMISAEVRGGEPTIRAGYRQFYQYISDYDIPVMANGFSFLITDRSREPDSTKWVTRFSAPIP